MAGNSQRRGATRKPGSKKGARVGTGGHSRKALEGKGPTPKAEERPYHPAYKAKEAAERRGAAQRRGSQAGRRTGGGRGAPHGTGSRQTYPEPRARGPTPRRAPRRP